MRPFWRYYGGKFRSAPRYPQPEHDTIVEPFAGAAGYSTRYHRKRVILIDKSPIIAGIWRFLIASSSRDIMAIPDVPPGGTVGDLDACQEARWLVGFWLSSAAASPRRTNQGWGVSCGASGSEAWPSAWSGWNHRSRQRVARQVEHIKHWQIIEGDYTAASDIEATWFVDPPYSTPAGSHYKEQPADFADLGVWCQSRRGLVVVCEQAGADWLPFEPLGNIKATLGKSAEVVWTNRPPAGWGVQLELLG